jgi:hypothetical protein
MTKTESRLAEVLAELELKTSKSLEETERLNKVRYLGFVHKLSEQFKLEKKTNT